MTPGSTGNVGKWSARYSSARLTYLTATIRSSERCSILSIRLNFTPGRSIRAAAHPRPRRDAPGRVKTPVCNGGGGGFQVATNGVRGYTSSWKDGQRVRFN